MRFAGAICRRWAVVLCALALLAGCDRVQPIYQVENHPIPQSATPLTLDQIEARIIKAGKLLTWDIRPVAAGKLDGRIAWRRHSAVVSIEYDRRSFSIRHKSSYNLLEETAPQDQPYAGQKVIHRQYNNRIRALENAIDAELAFGR